MDAELLDALQPGVAALGWTLIDTLWQGGLIAASYAIARLLLAAPRARLFAGHVALLALALAPLVTLCSYLAAGASPAAIAAPVLGAVLATTSAADAHAGLSTGWLGWLVAAWAGGVVLLSVRLWREWRRLQRLCADAEPLPPEWQQRFSRLCGQLKVRLQVRLLQGAQVATPMLVGVVRPVVLLPAGLIARMPVAQLELVLVHELAHLRRLDPLFNLLQTVLDTLLFYHPAVHWISRCVREDREICCDEVVLSHGGDRLSYARALLALAERESMGSGVPALAASGGVLLERVERIVEVPVAPRSPARVLVVFALAALFVLLWWPMHDDSADDISAGLAASMAPLAMPAPSMLAVPALDVVISDIAARLTAPRMQPPRTMLDADADADASLASVPDPIAPGVSGVVPFAGLGVSAIEQPAVSDISSPLSVELAALPAPEAITSTPSVTIAPLQRVAPAYPRSARLAGVEGWVVLEYRVLADGSIGSIAVAESHPAGTFDDVARRALERWQYAPGVMDAATLSQRFDFVLPDEEVSAAQNGADRCARRTGSRVCRPAHAMLSSSSLTPD